MTKVIAAFLLAGAAALIIICVAGTCLLAAALKELENI